MTDFIVVGNTNAVTYKEVFPLIKDNKMWLGQNVKGGSRKGNSLSFKCGNGEIKDVSSWWFTNLPVSKKPLILTQKYNPDKYPKYDNYDAIEVSKTKDIPYDYEGVMGVPISFLDKYNPEQFVIVGMAAGNSAVNGFGVEAGYTKHKKDRGGCPVLDGERIYTRIMIRFEILDARDYTDDERLKKKSTYLIKDADSSINGKPTYARILIRKKKEEEL